MHDKKRIGSADTTKRFNTRFLLLYYIVFFLIFLTPFFYTSPADCKPILLVKGGISEYTIYHDKNAPSSVYSAAKELQHYIKKVSGAHLSITTGPTTGKLISIGNNIYSRRNAIKTSSIPEEGYRIITRNDNIFIVGNDTPSGGTTAEGGTSPGSLFGTYTFIEEQLGVRWFMPGDIGEFIPRKDTIIIREIDILDGPDFKSREIPYIRNEKPAVKRWLLRNKVGGSQKLHREHYWHRAIPADMYKDHPEYFALIGGKRIKPSCSENHKLCTTNPGLIREYARAAIKRFSKSNKYKTYSLSPTDGRGWCQCVPCKRLDETDGEGKRFITRRIITFYNEVAKIVSREFPDRFLCGYIYADYVRPPLDKTITVHPNVKLVLAANYHRTLFMQESRTEWSNLIRDWSSLHPIASYYDFPAWFKGSYGQAMPPNKKILELVFPTLRKHHTQGLYMYGIDAWGHGAAFNYMFSKLAWDADQSIDELYDDFFTKYYGPGAKNMRTIYELIENELEQFCIQNSGISHLAKRKILRNVYAKNFQTIEKLYSDALSQTPPGKERKRLSAFGINLKVLHRSLRLFKALPSSVHSGFSMNENDYQTLLENERPFLALSPHVTSQASRKRITPVVGRPVRPPLKQGEPLKPYRLRGSQHIVLTPRFTGRIEITVKDVAIINNLIECSVYSESGMRLAKKTINQDTTVSFSGRSNSYYHIFLETRDSTFRLDVPENIFYAIDGKYKKRGLWFIARQHIIPPQRYIPTVYFQVPNRATKFDITISSTSPHETATADIYDASGNIMGTLSTDNRHQDTAWIRSRAGQGGIWKISLSPAQKGRFEDVWIKFGKSVNGYVSIEADKILLIEDRKPGGHLQRPAQYRTKKRR